MKGCSLRRTKCVCVCAVCVNVHCLMCVCLLVLEDRRGVFVCFKHAAVCWNALRPRGLCPSVTSSGILHVCSARDGQERPGDSEKKQFWQSGGSVRDATHRRKSAAFGLRLYLSPTIWASVHLSLSHSVSYSNSVASRVRIGQDVFRQII